MNITISEIDYAEMLRKTGSTEGLPSEVFELLYDAIQYGRDEVTDEIDCMPNELIERIRRSGDWKTIEDIAKDYSGDADDLELNPQEIAKELYPCDYAVELGDGVDGPHGVLMWRDIDGDTDDRRPEVTAKEGPREYTVTITERLARAVVVLASGRNEAERYVMDRYAEQEIVLGAEDFVGNDFETVESNSGTRPDYDIRANAAR